MRHLLKNSAFTLLELLLALAIFSIIAIATANQIRLLKNTKVSSMAEIDQVNGMRSALAMIRSDLSQAFHVQYDTLGSTIKGQILAGTPVAHTLFDGRKNEMVFTSLSHRVYYADMRECEQTEISYFLQEKKTNKYASLMKRESEFIDENLYEGGPVFTLLDNVTALEFHYWDDTNERWTDDWNSDGQTTRDKFPRAVKIKLSAWDPHTGKDVSIETSMKIAFPNNDPQLVKF